MEEALVCYLCENQIEDDKFLIMFGEIVCYPCYDTQSLRMLAAYSQE